MGLFGFYGDLWALNLIGMGHGISWKLMGFNGDCAV